MNLHLEGSKLKVLNFSILLFLLAFLTGLVGCVEASKFFSGNALTDDPAIAYPDSLESVHIDVTTQEEVHQQFGPPTDRQQASKNEINLESWSYGETDLLIQPYQYLPLIGVLAFLGDSEPQSFSMSFSEEGKVDGLGWRRVQAFGDAPYELIKFMPGTEIPSYGTNNPRAPSPRKLSDSSTNN